MIDVGLHGMEERLDEGIVGHLAGTVHALRDTQFGDALLEGAGRVLDATVGMEDQPAAGPRLRTALLSALSVSVTSFLGP